MTALRRRYVEVDLLFTHMMTRKNQTGGGGAGGVDNMGGMGSLSPR